MDMKFDDSKIKAERLKAIEQIDEAVLNERINHSYPDGEKEIAQLMTFVPEEERMPLLQAFVESLLQQ